MDSQPEEFLSTANLKRTASAAFVAFWLFCCQEKGRILFSLVKNMQLYFIWKFSTQKILAPGIFLQYS